MRIVKLLAILAIALLGAGASAVAATQRRQGPVVLHVKWHLVARTVNAFVIADDRYLFFVTSLVPAQGTHEGILVDRRTGRRTSINAPCAPSGEEHSSGLGTPYLGGPWLMLQCAYTAAYLYNPSTGQWTVINAPATVGQQPTCPGQPAYPGASPPVYVGTYWMRWGCEVQNIYTGKVKSDPVTSGSHIYDDLNVPSGVATLCSPLHYPGSQSVLRFYDGRVALTANASGTYRAHLLRCGSRFSLTIRLPPAAPIDSQAMAWATPTKRGPVILGIFFPGLRRFLIHPPHRFGRTPAPVALSRRTLYVQTAGLNGQLWAANLPQSP